MFISVFHILDLDFLFDHQASHKLLPVVKHLKHRRSNLNSFRVSTHPFLSLFLLTPFLMFLLLGPSLSQRFLIFLKIDNGMSECAK